MKFLNILILMSALPVMCQSQVVPSTGSAAGETVVQPEDLPGMTEPADESAAVISTPSVSEPLPLSAGPWEVSEITVKGNINMKPKVVTKTVRAKKKKLYYEEDKKTDIETLLALGGIDRVSISIDPVPGTKVSEKNGVLAKDENQVRVTYQVVEKPMIKEIKITGRKDLSKGAVRGEMSLGEKDFFDELRIREDLIKITEKYHEKGYIDVKVDYETAPAKERNKVVLEIKIFEGKKARIEAVDLNAEAFKKKKIIKKMKNRPKKIYKPGEIENDLKEIEKFYKTHGYSDFAVEDSSVTFSEDRSKVYVKVSVSEGKKYVFGDTTFTGNTVYTSRDLGELVEYKKGKIYNEEKLMDTLRSVQEKYADKGYLKAAIDPQKTADKNSLSLNFGITENEQIYVDHIDVEGNRATKTHVLRREIVQKEGEVFSLSKIRRSQEKIFNLGFIDDVNPVINPTQEPDRVDLVFDVTEGKPGMLTAGMGISSRDGLVGTLSASHMNMFGRAQRMSLSWNFGKRVQDYSLSWTTPWLGDKPTSLGFDVFNTRRYRSYSTTYSAYTERRTGGKVTLGPRFENDKYRLTTSYSYEKVRVSDVDDIYTGILQEGTSVNSSVFVEFARDTRDYIWDPTRGSRASLSLDLTGGILGGDVDFYKPTISYSWNKKLFSIGDYPFVFSAASRFGYVRGFGDTKEVPVYERFFLGGADTIRGYDSNGQVGPANGGKVYGVSNIEFKFPLAREKKRTIVQWAFFLDVGNSWENLEEVNFKIGSPVSQMKAGAGFGIRFTTPAFPIRLDWGYGFNHRTGEELSDIYFTIGNLF